MASGFDRRYEIAVHGGDSQGSPHSLVMDVHLRLTAPIADTSTQCLGVDALVVPPRPETAAGDSNVVIFG